MSCTMIGQKSKFACLKIEADSSDSSDDEVARKFNIKGSGPSKSKGSHSVQVKPGQKLVGGLVVHAPIDKSKNNKKKAKRPQVIDKLTGLVVQDADENFEDEQRYKEDLKEALRASLQTAHGEASTKSDDNKGSAAAAVSPSKEGSSTVAAHPTVIKASAFAEKGHGELLRLLDEKSAQLEAAEAAAEKYKWRYKRVIVLLHDSEVNERVQLAADLLKARNVEKELSTQVAMLSEQLEKAKSRIRELESKK